ncbi:EF-P lysine aminoacylase GenX [Kineobactrum sediminis]|uniref:EF-P lysine aminoacylase GenX n=1 Tax=Kineobactrum sediminis TaxID=1905677 RepID=A0A2N5Y7A0_9GAMM|nr:EF-P lysine aminoacylase EpmA [Kineobactrum sediminis]PLW84264.1 EF-P lysine aminoacylase GenX [Kineobactrum sediminis]
MRDWQPAASTALLRQRAGLLALIREFFAERGVLEVETPLLCRSGITDPAIEPLQVCSGRSIGADGRYLQTSPEYAMKRLLAAGSGSIYQVCKAFRDGEAGARHNPEFTLLEWYRPGLDHHQLMVEVADLVCHCLGPRPWQALSYRDLFLESLDIDPFSASVDTLCGIARGHFDVGNLEGDRDLWLDLLLTHAVEPWLAGRGICFVYDYPASQAALARIVERDGYWVAERFELYVDGLELANGYHELGDEREQRARFEADNRLRRQRGLATRPLDEQLLAALAAGLPACSGVALGMDRLLLCASGESDIRRVLAFPWERS